MSQTIIARELGSAERLVAIDAGCLRVPRTLFGAMGEPAGVRLIPENPGHYFLRSETPSPLPLAGWKTAWRRLRGKPSTGWRARLLGLEGGFARYRVDASPFVPEHGAPSGLFHVANYETEFYLMPVDAVDESASRQARWAEIADYHEHRAAEAQDDSAHRVSAWLADVIAEHHPGSVLELGCGAGRNLLWIQRRRPEISLGGVDINEAAARRARAQLGAGTRITTGSLYDLARWESASVDLVFTAGVLMHVPHERVGGVVTEMHRIARRAVLHFELHGPSHDFDYHRYPRDYAALYRTLGREADFSYTVFPRDDFRSAGTSSFQHALAVSERHAAASPS